MKRLKASLLYVALTAGSVVGVFSLGVGFVAFASWMLGGGWGDGVRIAAAAIGGFGAFATLVSFAFNCDLGWLDAVERDVLPHVRLPRLFERKQGTPRRADQ